MPRQRTRIGILWTQMYKEKNVLSFLHVIQATNALCMTKFELLIQQQDKMRRNIKGFPPFLCRNATSKCWVRIWKLLRPANPTQASVISSLFRQTLKLGATSCLSRSTAGLHYSKFTLLFKGRLLSPPNYAIRHHPVNENPTPSIIHLSNVSILMTLLSGLRGQEVRAPSNKVMLLSPSLFRNQIFIYTSTIHSVCLSAFVEQ
jgi:hypothetical protein